MSSATGRWSHCHERSWDVASSSVFLFNALLIQTQAPDGLSCLSPCYLSFCKWYSRRMMRITGSVWKYGFQGFISDQHNQWPGRGWGDLYFYETSHMILMNQPHLGTIGLGHILYPFFICHFVLAGGLPAVCGCVTLGATVERRGLGMESGQAGFRCWYFAT